MLLADATVSLPADSGSYSWLVVLTLVTLSSLAVNVVNLMRSGQAQKRVVSITTEFASSAEQLKLEARIIELERNHDAIRAEMKEDRNALMEAGEQRATDLGNRIHPIVENTAFIKGRMEAFTESFQNYTRLLEKRS